MVKVMSRSRNTRKSDQLPKHWDGLAKHLPYGIKGSHERESAYIECPDIEEIIRLGRNTSAGGKQYSRHNSKKRARHLIKRRARRKGHDDANNMLAEDNLEELLFDRDE